MLPVWKLSLHRLAHQIMMGFYRKGIANSAASSWASKGVASFSVSTFEDGLFIDSLKNVSADGFVLTTCKKPG